jgi:Flp pilus assembly protein TadG
MRVKSSTAAVTSSVTVICTDVLMSCATAVAKVVSVSCCLSVGLVFWTLVCGSYCHYESLVHAGYNRSLLAGAMAFHRDLK